MFRRLKEKISEEVKQSPLRQYSPFKEESSKSDVNGTEGGQQNLIDLRSSEAGTVDLHVGLPENQAFSIGGDEEDADGASAAASETTSPTPGASFENVDLSDNISTPPGSNRRHRRLSSTEASTSGANLFPIYSPAVFNHSVQSDLESTSEVDDSVVNLEVISKAQLYAAFQKAKSRYLKYKTRYGEVIRAYKDQVGETDKVKSILSESQDKALRRISEMKEQSQLDQKAKQHLEENFRETLDERDELVRVLQTQVRLLKSGVTLTETTESSDLSDGKGDNETDSDANKKLRLQEDTINKLKNLLKNCKETITKQRESLEKSEAESNARMASFGEEIRRAAEKADLLERREENRAVQLAESKRLMHEDLEVREKNERHLKEQLQRAVADLETEIKKSTDLASELDAARSAATCDENKLAESEATLRTVVSECDKIRADNRRLESDAVKLASEIAGMRSKLDITSRQSSSAEEEMVASSEAIEALSCKLVERDAELEVLTSRLLAANKKAARDKVEREKLDEELIRAEHDRQELRVQLEAAREQHTREEAAHVQRVQEESVHVQHVLENELTELKSAAKKYEELLETQSTEKAELELRLAKMTANKAEEGEEESIATKSATKMVTMTKETVANFKQKLIEMTDMVQSERREMQSKSASLSRTFQSLVLVNRDLQDRYDSLNSRNETTESELESVRETMSQLEQRLEVAETANRDFENEISKRTVEAAGQSHVLENAIREADELKERLSLERNRAEHSETEIGSLRTSNEKLATELRASSQHSQLLSSQLESLKSQVDAFTERLNSERIRGENSLQENVSLRTTNEKLLLELDALRINGNQESQSINSQSEDLKERLNAALIRAENSEVEVKSLRAANEKLTVQLRTGGEETQWLSSQAEAVKAEMAALMEHLNSERIRSEHLGVEISLLRTTNKNLAAELESVKSRSGEECQSLRNQSEVMRVEMNALEARLNSERIRAENYDLEVNSLRTTNEKLSTELRTSTEDCQSLSGKLEALTIEMENVKERINSQRIRAENSQLEVSSLRAANEQLLAEFDLLRINRNDECQLMSSQSEALKSEIEALKERMNSERILAEDSELEVNSLRTTNENLAAELKSVKSRSDEECQSLRNRSQVMRVEMDALEARLNMERVSIENLEVSSLRTTNEKLTTDLKASMEDCQSLSGQLEALAIEIKNLKEQMSSERIRAENSQLEVSSLRTMNETLTADLRGSTDEHKSLAGQSELLKSEMDALKRQRDDLQMEFHNLSAKIEDDDRQTKLATERIASLQLEVEALNRRQDEVLEGHRIELEDVRQKHKDKLNELNQKFKAKLKSMASKQSAITSKQAEEKAEVDECVSRLNDLVQELSSKILKLEESVTSAEHAVQVLRAENEAVKSELLLKDDQNRTSEAVIRSEFEEHLRKVNAEKADLIGQLESEEERIGRLQEEALDRSSYEERISRLEGRLDAQKDKLAEYEAERVSLMASVATLNGQIDESLVTAQQNETHSTRVQQELRGELDECLRRHEDEKAELERRAQQTLSDEVRLVTRHYEVKMAEREKEATRELADAVEQGLNEDNRMRRAHAKQIREIGAEVAENQAALETALGESRDTIKTLESELKSVRAEHEQQLHAIEAKWKSHLEKASHKLEASHREELDGLYQEWQIEKRDLQKEAGLATLVLESGDHSSELLRRQIMTMQTQMEVLKDRHRNEVLQLKDAMRTNNCPIPRLVDADRNRDQRLESMEIEYLKNILFEYMMGRERLTMAKVISAVVRFSAEQTNKVLEREEGRSGVGGQVHEYS